VNRWRLRDSGLGGYPFGESPFWEKLLHRLSQRGLQKVELAVTDDTRRVWKALNVVCPKAQASSAYGILGEL